MGKPSFRVNQERRRPCASPAPALVAFTSGTEIVRCIVLGTGYKTGTCRAGDIRRRLRRASFGVSEHPVRTTSRGKTYAEGQRGTLRYIYPVQLDRGLNVVLLLRRSLFVVVYYGAVSSRLRRITKLATWRFLYLILGTRSIIRHLRGS